MDFKRKLSYLPTPSTPPVNVPASLAPEHARGNLIDELRSKMAAILERPLSPEPPPQAADPSATALPFARVETPEGPIYRRHVILPPSHHVGRMPVDSARASRPELLALLALDPSLSGIDLGRALFLDTETTGLGGAGAIAFLLGLAWFDAEQRLNVEQLL